MENLNTKYLRDSLTPEELLLLRGQVESVSDTELGLLLQKGWDAAYIDESKVDDKKLKEVKNRIDANLTAEAPRRSTLHYLTRIAAVILLPVFILSTLYLYRENTIAASQEMVVATEKGEKANVTLPDGTKVILNSDSRLSYIPQAYNRDERRINFNGEGYFKVEHKKEVPFIIDAAGLRTKVIGTAFNLFAREQENFAELTLDEGRVSFESLLTKGMVQPNVNQKAILNKSTGRFEILSVNAREASAWKYNDLKFYNAKLPDVINAIENSYGTVIKITDGGIHSDDQFTGSIPSSDLMEALEIIERSYNLKVSMTENNITLEASKP